jgi:hypothetical protein
MIEANQYYHPQIVRAIIAVALYEARKEIKRNIQREGRIKLSRVPAREIERMAKVMVMERRDEFLARVKASPVVQDELRRLQAKDERERRRGLERNFKHLSNSESLGSQGLRLNDVTHRIERRNDSRPCSREHGWSDARRSANSIKGGRNNASVC